MVIARRKPREPVGVKLRKVIGGTTVNETDGDALAVTLRQLFELLLP